MESSSRSLAARRGAMPVQLLLLFALAASLLVVVATPPANAQGGATIVPNISTTRPYSGPGVVLSGTASSPIAITGVSVSVQNAETFLYVQDAAGTMGPAAVSLDAFTALLPPPGDMSVSWRVPLQLAEGNYNVTIAATESNSLITTAGPLVIVVESSTAVTDEELIARDAIWAYSDLGETPPEQNGALWYLTAYSAATWNTGPAELGYGDGGEATLIAETTALGDPLITAYFRHDFMIADLDTIEDFEMTLSYDDGAIVYVNGQEWRRFNMKSVGPVRYDTLAVSTAEDTVTEIIDEAFFVVGQNNISVEVHQVAPSSSDISFSLGLIGTSGIEPGLESDARPGTYILTAGDIARCNHDGDENITSQMNELFDTDAGVFIGLGDPVYTNGTISEFLNCYDPTLGQFKSVTWPSPGNHEHYTAPNAAGYREYFGEAAGPLAGPAGGLWYSFDIDDYWHVIALDSDCRGREVLPGALNGDGCAVGSAQEIWLRADLEANKDKNILAFFHHPPYTNNHYTDHTYTWPLWRALTEYGTDITLHGHEHHYERYTPMNAWGEPDSEFGAREFIIGSGGTFPRYNVRSPDPRSEFKGTFPQNTFDYGALQLWLRPDGYDWKWEPIFGSAATDEGTSGLAQPYPKGAITGTVTSADGIENLAAIDVCVTSARTAVETCTTTDAAGAFAFDPVFIGDYAMTFTDPAGAYTTQTSDLSVAAEGASTTVALAGLSRMRGRLTIDGSGEPLVGATVCATPEPLDGSGCATVTETGTWELQGLDTGVYTIEFSARGFRSECYFNDDACLAPRQLAVTAGTDLLGINAGMTRQQGDVNCDGALNILDAFAMAQYAVELRTDNGACPLVDTNTTIYLGDGDANLDGNYNIADAFSLAECAVGLPSDFCPDAARP